MRGIKTPIFRICVRSRCLFCVNRDNSVRKLFNKHRRKPNIHLSNILFHIDEYCQSVEELK